MRNALKFAIILCVVSLALAPAAMADSAQANVSVTANIPQVCIISAGTMAFGAYDPINTNATSDLQVDGGAIISVTCTNGATGVSVALGQGLHWDSENSVRTMTGAVNTGDQLKYKLYSDDTYTTEWNATTTVSPAADGTEHSYNVYGEVLAGQNLIHKDSFSDTVVATVNF